jgi:hypothetical protein
MKKCREIKDSYENLLEEKSRFDLLYSLVGDFNEAVMRKNALDAGSELHKQIDSFSETTFKSDFFIKRRLNALIKEMNLGPIELTVKDGRVSFAQEEPTEEMIDHLLILIAHPRTPISAIDFSGKRIQPRWLLSFGMALRNAGNKVEFLSLADTPVANPETGLNAELRFLMLSLKHPPNKIKELDLERVSIRDAGLEYLAEAMQNPNCRIQKLNIAGITRNSGPQANPNVVHFITEAGAGALAGALKRPGNDIRELDISQNMIKIAAAELLAGALQDPRNQVRVLKLKRTNLFTDLGGFSDDTGWGCILLPALMSPDNKLVELDLTGAAFMSKDTDELIRALINPNCKLKKIHLPSGVRKIAGIGISRDGIDLIKRTLKENNKDITVIFSPEHKVTAR